jgi:hypothetical protein
MRRVARKCKDTVRTDLRVHAMGLIRGLYRGVGAAGCAMEHPIVIRRGVLFSPAIPLRPHID